MMKDKQVNEEGDLEYIKQATDKIIENINDRKKISFDRKKADTQVAILKAKVRANAQYGNKTAMLRDGAKILMYENATNLIDLINDIIVALDTFKSKDHYTTLFETELKRINSIDLSQYSENYTITKEKTDKISQAFNQNFNFLQNQIQVQDLITHELQNNMNKYRSDMFLIDEFSLQFIIGEIDNLPYIKDISSPLKEYLNVSVGKIVIVFVVLFLVFFINRVVLPFVIRMFEKMIDSNVKSIDMSSGKIFASNFINALRIFMYVLGAKVAFLLVVDDIKVVKNTIPFFNTAFMAIFGLMVYQIISNYIGLASARIISKYPKVRSEIIDFFLRMVKVLIFILLVLFLLVQFGFDIKAIIASLGIGGVAVALAAKDTLSNFFGSLNILADNSFSQGDWIVSGGVEGTVVDIRMRTTRIRTFDNALITVPNAQLVNTPILNWSKRKIGRRIKMYIGITYSSKMKDIVQLVHDLRAHLKENPKIAKPEQKYNFGTTSYLIKTEDLLGVKNTLLVYIDEYAASSINIMIYCFSRSPVWADWLETKEELIIKIAQLVEKNNCDFAFPTQSLFVENEINHRHTNNDIIEKK